jgi:glycine/D-amino acid oxidase-like deaminating enzyme
MAAQPRIAVIGAGIVGCALAFRLSRAGAAVTLIDALAPGGGVTARAFGWIGAQCPAGRADAPLKRAALPAWRRLEADLGGSLVAWTGSLLWRASREATQRLLDEESHQRGLRPLKRPEIARAAPALIDPPPLAAFAPEEGATDPAAVARLLARAAQGAGARIVTGGGPAALALAGGVVRGVEIAGERAPADVVIVAAGAASPEVCAPAGLDLGVDVSPAVMVRLACPDGLAGSIHEGPACEVRPVAGGLFAAEDFQDGAPLDEIAAATAAAVRRTYRGADGVTVIEAAVGHRPMPRDGLPRIGFAPEVQGLYVTVMHSGVTLAPIVAELAAREILGYDRDPLLAGLAAIARPGAAG